MKRMKKAGIAALLLVLFCAAAAIFRQENEQTRYTATFLDVFDTKTEIVGYAGTKEAFAAQAEQIKEKLIYYHQLYDIYHEYEGINSLKTINDHAGKSPVEVSADIRN